MQGFGKKILLWDLILPKPVIFYIPFPSILFKKATKSFTFKFDLPFRFFPTPPLLTPSYMYVHKIPNRPFCERTAALGKRI